MKAYKKGYTDAVNDACAWWKDYLTYPNEVELDKEIRKQIIDSFMEAMKRKQNERVQV